MSASLRVVLDRTAMAARRPRGVADVIVRRWTAACVFYPWI